VGRLDIDCKLKPMRNAASDQYKLEFKDREGKILTELRDLSDLLLLSP
jgi:hypothetical protein